MIRGYFDEQGRPRLKCNIEIPRLGISDEIDFLMDTGAYKTTILPGDGQMIGLPYNRLRGNISIHGIGGSSRHFWERVILDFNDNGATITRLIDIGIMPYGYAPQTFGLPSLLGRDVLNGWRILYDQPANRLECAIHTA